MKVTLLSLLIAVLVVVAVSGDDRVVKLNLKLIDIDIETDLQECADKYHNCVKLVERFYNHYGPDDNDNPDDNPDNDNSDDYDYDNPENNYNPDNDYNDNSDDDYSRILPANL